MTYMLAKGSRGGKPEYLIARRGESSAPQIRASAHGQRSKRLGGRRRGRTSPVVLGRWSQLRGRVSPPARPHDGFCIEGSPARRGGGGGGVVNPAVKGRGRALSEGAEGMDLEGRGSQPSHHANCSYYLRCNPDFQTWMSAG